jgi:hypothetical protein
VVVLRPSIKLTEITEKEYTTSEWREKRDDGRSIDVSVGSRTADGDYILEEFNGDVDSWRPQNRGMDVEHRTRFTVRSVPGIDHGQVLREPELRMPVAAMSLCSSLVLRCWIMTARPYPG